MERFITSSILSNEKVREIAEKEIVKGDNPCLNKLVYMETRATEKTPRKIFPAYPFTVMPGKDEDVLVVFIVQFIMHSYGTAAITIPMSDVGKTCRFWDLPPTDEAMDKIPLADVSGVQ